MLAAAAFPPGYSLATGPSTPSTANGNSSASRLAKPNTPAMATGTIQAIPLVLEPFAAGAGFGSFVAAGFSGFGSFGFLSQHGSVPVDSLPLVSEGAKPMPAASAPAASPPSAAEPPRPASATPGGGGDGDLLATLERLAQLKDKGVLTEAEFAAKKAEILSRL